MSKTLTLYIKEPRILNNLNEISLEVFETFLVFHLVTYLPHRGLTRAK